MHDETPPDTLRGARFPRAPRVSTPALLFSLGTLLLPGTLAAQDSDPLSAHRVTAETAEADFRLDGLLAEPFWQHAEAISDFRQREPDVGEAATEETRVRVVVAGDVLYVGVEALDSEPDRIVSRILQRDRLMSTGFGPGIDWAGDDGVAILLDPFHDHRNGVVLATNPNGAQFDALITDEGREVNVSWRGVWRVRAARTQHGWSAEFEIPLRSLRYPDDAGGEPWGFNVYRMIRRKNEEALWRSWSRQNEGFHRVSRAGHLTGLTDLPRPGLNLEAKPYLLTGTDQVRRADGEIPANGELEVGLDLKSELRPGLVLDLTANTDFAQVEVDDEQVNLTRFDLFFPEKRDFFLENAGIFELGIPGFGGPPSMLVFFSRRIGIGPSGQEVPILGGARLTGRIGNQTLGFMNVTTDEVGPLPRENFAVARVKRDLGERDYLGFMVTDRRRLGDLPEAALAELDPGEDPDLVHPANTVVGVDGSYWLTERLQFQGFGVRSFTEGPGGDDNAYRAALDFTADRWGFFVQHLTIEPELTTRSGFTLRTDIRQNTGFFRLSPRPDLLGLRKVDFRFQGMYQTRTDGAFQDWSGGLEVFPLWDSGDNLTVGYTPGETRVDRGFPLAGRVDVPAGRYRTDNLMWRANTSESRAVSLGHSGSVQDFFGGDLVRLGGSLRVAPSPSVEAELGYSRNRVDVPGGAFTTDIGSLRLAYSFSTRLSTNLLMQYNSLDEVVSTNLRVNFIHRPGSDLFVVLTETRGESAALGTDSVWDLQDRGFVVKLTWLERF